MKLRGVLVFFWLAATLTAWGRGGGGCFELGTPILTPHGAVPIQQIKIGDTVCSVRNGAIFTATVLSQYQVEPESYLEVSVAGRKLKVTGEHPFQISEGVFRTAESLKPGDRLWFWDGEILRPASVESIRRVPAQAPAYNLLVNPGGTYLADGVLVHNKGCFLPDTPILRADGTQLAIRDVQPGQRLMAFTGEGKITSTTVQKVITHQAEDYFIVTTDMAELKVTGEHPFFVGNGTFKTLESLHMGDTIFAHDGHNNLQAQIITGMQEVHSPALVYNLQTDAPNTYFANGVAVHNKGGGCFPAGTPILTPKGEVAIERLAAGDTIFAVDGAGRLVETRIQISYQTVSTLLIFETDGGNLTTTAEHPLMDVTGVFRVADSFHTGERLMVFRNKHAQPAIIRAIRETHDLVSVFNLRVGNPHTFVASGFVVHNKGGGCFPAGTLIETSGGRMPIEQLKPGLSVIAVGAHDRAITSPITTIFTAQSPLVLIETDRGTLRTTAEHPLRRIDGSFCAAADLSRGDEITFWQTGALQPARVTSVIFGSTQTAVFNLTVGEPHTFIADGFVAHNKGGGFGGGGGSWGGGGSYSRGSSGSSSMTDEETKQALQILFGIVALVILIVVANAVINGLWKSQEDEDLDFVFDKKAMNLKIGKTAKLLQFIARVDPDYAPDALANTARATFLKLQERWESRKYAPMEPFLMPDLYALHCKQIAGLIRNHEINRISELAVQQIDIVNVRYTHKNDDREFTALITASARDHYVDDRTGEWLRGDEYAASFQEFWTFQRQDKDWLLREIDQSREADALKEENFFEQFTDDGVQKVYEEEAGKEGPIGPWMVPGTESKASRTERLLNFLVTLDRLWNRNDMLERTRETFLEVKLSWESLTLAPEVEAKLFPDIAADLREEMEKQQSRGSSFELRNLCIRKVDIVLVRNYADNSQDEFTVRIRAHAQNVIRRNKILIDQQEYVTPFEEYWTFGRLDNQWKLKEVLPPARGESMVEEENVDDESSPEQLQWYYQQSRAK